QPPPGHGRGQRAVVADGTVSGHRLAQAAGQVHHTAVPPQGQAIQVDTPGVQVGRRAQRYLQLEVVDGEVERSDLDPARAARVGPAGRRVGLVSEVQRIHVQRTEALVDRDLQLGGSVEAHQPLAVHGRDEHVERRVGRGPVTV